MTNPSPPSSNQPQQSSIIDLNQIANQSNLEVDLKIKTPKSRFDQIVELVSLVIISLILLVAISYCFQILTSPQSSPEDKKNAQSTITLIIGGAIGYFVGRTTANQT
jgi:D-alanyl-lipoteichoic acid acyltransferase DltB (MBOAT superfamily)